MITLNEKSLKFIRDQNITQHEFEAHMTAIRMILRVGHGFGKVELQKMSKNDLIELYLRKEKELNELNRKRKILENTKQMTLDQMIAQVENNK